MRKPTLLSLGSNVEEVLLAPIIPVMGQQNLLPLHVLYRPPGGKPENPRDLEQLQLRLWHLGIRDPQCATEHMPR